MLQIFPSEQPRRADLLWRGFGQKGLHKVVARETAMAREAVEAMQFQVLLEARQSGKALKSRIAHLRHVLEAHVVRHQRDDLLGVVVRETKTAANFLGHAHADLHMLIEANAVIRAGSGAKRRR